MVSIKNVDTKMDIPVTVLISLAPFSPFDNPCIVSHVPVIFSQVLVPLANPLLLMIF